LGNVFDLAIVHGLLNGDAEGFSCRVESSVAALEHDEVVVEELVVRMELE
jgi:hypothetical protein